MDLSLMITAAGFGPDSAGVQTLAEGFFLVSWWKALLVFPPFLAWAWLVSTVFDKHAQRFYLQRDAWNAGHMVAGLLAVLVALFFPVAAWWGFIVGYIVMLAILAIDIAAFVVVTNQNERVPAKAKLKLDFSKLAESSKAKKDAKLAATVTLRIENSSGLTVTAPQKDTPEYEIRGAAEELFTKAIELRAYQAEIVPVSAEAYQSRYLVDGVHQPGEKMPAAQGVAIIDFWKSCGELDLKDRRRRLVGKCRVTGESKRHDIRIASAGVQGGIRMTLTLDPGEAVDRKPEYLGLLDPQMETLKSLVADGSGVVLLAAPALNGRTTTLYTVVRMHDAYTQNVQTLELEPQHALEGVRQVIFSPSEGAEFATTLRSILRRDPDVVGVAELPDGETAKEALKGDHERTRTYVSVRADGTLAATQLFVKAAADANLVADGLRGAVAQKLARKLCENCRVPYQPPADLLKKLGLPEGKVKQLFKKGGQVLIRNKPEVCPICSGVGYNGQIGIFEVFPFGEEEKAMIREQNWSGLRAEMRKKSIATIQQAALRRVVEGVTSVEEITRITAPPQKTSSSKQPAKTPTPTA